MNQSQMFSPSMIQKFYLLWPYQKGHVDSPPENSEIPSMIMNSITDEVIIIIRQKEKNSSFPVSQPTQCQNPRPKKFSGIFKVKYMFGQFY